jgi:hypothetical protein
VTLTRSERGQQRVRLVFPYRPERTITDVAEGVPLPELREVDVSDGVDVGDALAGRVAPVALEVLSDCGRLVCADLSSGVLDEVARVGVVPDEQRLDGLASVVIRTGQVTQLCDRFASRLGREVGVGDVRAAAAVIEVIKTEAVDADVDEEVDDPLEVLDVVLGDGVPESGLESDVETRLDPADRGVKCPGLPADPVVSVAESVDGDAGVLETGIAQLAGSLAGEKRPVRREDGSNASVRGVRDERREVLTDQRFSAGEQQHRHAVVGEIVDQRSSLGRRELTRGAFAVGPGVTVLAGEVTLLGRVPHHDRSPLSVLGDLWLRGLVGRVVPEPVALGVEPAQQLAHGDHRRPSLDSVAGTARVGSACDSPTSPAAEPFVSSSAASGSVVYRCVDSAVHTQMSRAVHPKSAAASSCAVSGVGAATVPT